MAQLARCPACYCELEVPEDSTSTAKDAWVECPECEKVFALDDGRPRSISVARRVSAPDAGESSAKEPTSPTDSAPKDSTETPPLGSSTLASFLDDADAIAERDKPEVSDESPSSVELGDFKSLDDLFKQAGVPNSTENEASQGEHTQAADETAIASAAAEETVRADELKSSEEPSPAADRMRPTLDDAADAESLLTDSNPTFDSAAYIPVEDAIDDASESDQSEESSGELDVDAENTKPVFDFAVGDDHGAESSKSLRASLGLSDELALEPVEELLPVGEEENELEFNGVETPRGVVAARRRSSGSLVKSVVGIAGGGVVGLAAGYLLLLWIFHFMGRTDEPLNLAQYYPDAVKPAEFRDVAAASDTDIQPSPVQPPGDSSVASSDHDQPEPIVPSNFQTELPSNDTPPEPWQGEASPVQLPSVETVAISGAPEYTAAQLQQLTALANEASPRLLAGSLDDPAARPAKGSSYAEIAKLADALTFGEGPAEASWKAQARAVFPKLFATDQSQREIAVIAGVWRTSGKRFHGGIFFSGTPDAGRQQGSVAEYVFTLPNGEQLMVVTPQALTSEATSSPILAVVGSVIDKPAERIEGYTGTADQVIWSEDLLPVGR